MPLHPDPIVVLGAPRSGTTYLREILDSHPHVELSNEVRLFEWLHRAMLLARDDRALFEQRESFTAHLRTALPAAIRAWYAAKAPEARWWGDKNPHYAEDRATLETVAELFPGARFLRIVRDPRAVVASLLKKRHADGTPWVVPEEAHVMVATHLDVADAFGATRHADGFRSIRYEDLVADDEAVARDVFAWLGIPFADEVAAFCRGQRQQRTAFSGPTADLSTVGRRDAAHRAWEAVVPPAERRRSLLFFAPHLLRHGYEDPASLDARNRALPDD